MDWDALAALADGGSAYLAKKDTLRKEELAQKLENDKLEKAHQWEIDRENRAEARVMNTPSDKVEFFDRDGVTMKRIYGGRNNILDEVPASQDEIKDRAKADRKDNLTFRALENTVAKGDLDIKYADEDHALATQRDRASLAETVARTGSYNRANTPEAKGYGTASVDQSPGALTNQLIKEFPDLQKEYTEGDDDNDPTMSKSMFREIAQEVVIRAAKRGVDPRIAFAEALKAYKAK
jgi:hypothetical protein